MYDAKLFVMLVTLLAPQAMVAASSLDERTVAPGTAFVESPLRKASMDQPSGLTSDGKVLYLTDGEASIVHEADFDPQERLATIIATAPFGNVDALGEEVWLEPQRVAAGPGKVVLEVGLPEGYKANYLAPFSIAWRSEDAHVVVAPEHASHSIGSPDFPLRLEFPAHFSEGEGLLTGELTIYYCREGAEALCLVERVRVRLPVLIEREGASALRVAYQASALEPW